MEVPYILDVLVSVLLLIGLFFLLTGIVWPAAAEGCLHAHARNEQKHHVWRGRGGPGLAALLAVPGTLLGLERVSDRYLSLSDRPGRGAYDRPGRLPCAGVSLWQGGVVDDFKKWLEANQS